MSGLTTANEGDALVTDAAGNLVGVFNLPNQGENGLRFKTGERTFRVLDDPNKADPVDSTTSADATYRASGQKKVMQNTTITTRVQVLFVRLLLRLVQYVQRYQGLLRGQFLVELLDGMTLWQNHS